MDLRLVYITAKDSEEALSIGRTIVTERLAACVNIIDGVSSVYWWKGKVEEGGEAILIAKTVEANVAKLTERVRELHSYDTPAIVTAPVCEASDAYAVWVRESVTSPASCARLHDESAR